jgi:hypothetical protein
MRDGAIVRAVVRRQTEKRGSSSRRVSWLCRVSTLLDRSVVMTAFARVRKRLSQKSEPPSLCSPRSATSGPIESKQGGRPALTGVAIVQRIDTPTRAEGGNVEREAWHVDAWLLQSYFCGGESGRVEERGKGGRQGRPHVDPPRASVAKSGLAASLLATLCELTLK